MHESKTGQTQELPVKPLLRGYLHQEALFVALGAAIILMTRAPNVRALFAVSVYSLGLWLLFGISAAYHRIHWQPQARSLMKRLDHSAIFFFIASSMTPLALLALAPEDGRRLLVVIWMTAGLGVLQSIFWVKAPKWVTAILYVIAGWLAFPYLPLMRQTLSSIDITLLIAGGTFYTIGAAFYASKRPRLWPKVFSYHELFHLFTIIAASLHFAVIYSLMK